MYVAMFSMWGAPLPFFMQGREGAGAFALTQLLLTIPIIWANRPYFTRGFGSLFKGHPNMDSLIAVGAGASLAYGIFALYQIIYGFGFALPQRVDLYRHDLYFESAAMILTLITIGKYMESRSKSKTTDSLKKLLSLRPAQARVVRDDKEFWLPLEEVRVGDKIRIKPGEIIPVDGKILEGETSIDQASITGESIPVAKAPGDRVISSTLNQTGTILFEASQVGEDTTISQIIALVEDANVSKAPIQRLADKIAGVFVPVVIAIALVVFAIWFISGAGFEFSLRLAITVLVISCPCALGLATPVAIMVGSGKGAENGILFKNAEALEVLHEVDTLVLDKTGTITEGKPVVTDIIPLGDYDPQEILSLAASLEQHSEQPLAFAILEKAKEDGTILRAIEDFKSHPGKGVSALLDSETILGGNSKLMTAFGIDISAQEEAIHSLADAGKTPMYFAYDGRLIGLIAARDEPKKTSAKAIEALHKAGLDIMMLTGDNENTASAMADELGLDHYRADVLPQDKHQVIEDLQAQGKKVAMVGDGVNDAPALKRADIGIALGAGTDIAMDSADLVLIKSDLMDVYKAFRLSQRTVRIIKENLFWAFIYNILLIPVAGGILYPIWNISLNPMLAALAMSISSTFVVLNALRLRNFGKKEIQ